MKVGNMLLVLALLAMSVMAFAGCPYDGRTCSNHEGSYYDCFISETVWTTGIGYNYSVGNFGGGHTLELNFNRLEEDYIRLHDCSWKNLGESGGSHFGFTYTVFNVRSAVEIGQFKQGDTGVTSKIMPKREGEFVIGLGISPFNSTTHSFWNIGFMAGSGPGTTTEWNCVRVDCPKGEQGYCSAYAQKHIPSTLSMWALGWDPKLNVTLVKMLP
ncbi:MAG: hypothetical protein A3J01_00995 [Candidatus Yanofskybacteria bacterium RIFCSPLOWO2_02_FULL_45_18]|uniref:Uncharacterized protein n=1 Tax=Candidatus Yanofskybacteria bacterium RIFCSPLOWO2_02_FULL_45_18 TaxID=1802707 RepID=A0A1F8H6Q2_9BACT|nr:MAG: hypothetical protein A3J01_00995 [Candidatus Yanofskybacteria bacterium RIFCSPLOWO2_02_FULL_45_18]